jgi:hypothetical protein
MRVRFSFVEEFLDELTQDAHLIEEGIIRITLNYQPLEMKPLALLSVHAGVIVNGKIIELHQAIGHVWQPPAGGQDDAKVRTRAQDICAQVEAQASVLGLVIRRGVFHP